MSPAHNEWEELLALGDADAWGLLGVRVDVLRRGVLIASGAPAVLSPISAGNELDLGGGVDVITATASIPRDAAGDLAPGDVLRTSEGDTYTISRVASLPCDPSFRLELTQ